MLLFFLLITGAVHAQDSGKLSAKTFHIGIFAPLYLDSVFNTAGNFKYTQDIPKFIIPGVDFVQGAEIALDSMSLNGQNVSATFYDTKSKTKPISTLIKSKSLDTLDLIIGSVKDIEFKQLAAFALQKNIPFVSSTYPNDGGVKNNPFLIILTSTLKSHCEAIYSYILSNNSTDDIYLVRKKGSQEDKVAGFFKKINEQDGKPLLAIKTINLDSAVSSDFFSKRLDSNHHSVIIGASLDEDFAVNLAHRCNELSDQFPLTLIGMPDWDGFKDLYDKSDFKDFPIYYTTPYFNNKWDEYSKIVINAYAQNFKSIPSDMSFRGFESTYFFTKLLLTHKQDMMNHLDDDTYKVFSDFNFKPVYLSKESRMPDYFENKHLYFIKILNGRLVKAP
jgi:hypothetical protein